MRAAQNRSMRRLLEGLISKNGLHLTDEINDESIKGLKSSRFHVLNSFHNTVNVYHLNVCLLQTIQAASSKKHFYTRLWHKPLNIYRRTLSVPLVCLSRACLWTNSLTCFYFTGCWNALEQLFSIVVFMQCLG